MSPSVSLEGALNRAASEMYVAELSVTTLHPGQIVMCDDLGVQKSAHARPMIDAAGAEVWFLPRSSPVCNPIVLAVARFKHVVRRAHAGTFDTVVTATGIASETFTAQDAHEFVQAAGHPL
jgi:putative transposase